MANAPSEFRKYQFDHRLLRLLRSRNLCGALQAREIGELHYSLQAATHYAVYAGLYVVKGLLLLEPVLQASPDASRFNVQILTRHQGGKGIGTHSFIHLMEELAALASSGEESEEEAS